MKVMVLFCNVIASLGAKGIHMVAVCDIDTY